MAARTAAAKPARKNAARAAAIKTKGTQTNNARTKFSAPKTKVSAKKAAVPKTKKIKKALTSLAKPAKTVKVGKATKPVSKKAAKPAPTPKKAVKPADLSLLTPKDLRPHKVPKTTKAPLGYTNDQYEKYKSEKKRLINFGNAQLKEILKKNMQSMSGNKDEMVEKIADGIALGRIPRCPSCFGGRPKFDAKTATYHCSGYRDDTDFVNCHKTFNMAQIVRDPWE